MGWQEPGLAWAATSRVLPRNLSSDSAAIYDSAATVSDFVTALNETTGLLVLFGHNYADADGFHFSGGDARLENLSIQSSNAKITVILGCRSADSLSRLVGPLKPGHALIGLKKVTDIWMINAYLRPLVKALESGMPAQSAVNEALTHLSRPLQKVFTGNPVVLGDRNARL